MRKRNIILPLLFGVAVFVSSQGFKHPGMLHTNEDFARIKAQIAASEPSVVAGYNNLKANEWSQSTVNTWPVDIIKRGVTGDENYINAARGAHAAYLNALRWKISGDVAHANKAISILNSWAGVTTALGGNSNVSLASGLYGYEFANAAELMRDYSGWKANDFRKFQDWMLKVWYPYAYDFLIRRHDTWAKGSPGHYWSNWGLCNVLAVMSIGILLDDEFIYNQGIAFYKYDKTGTFRQNRTAPVDNDGLTEFIGNLVPTVAADTAAPLGYYGQMQESGRDQGHATMALGLAVDICETAWNQGDDLYGLMNDRLLAGIEYVAGYNSGVDDLPWTEYWYHDVRTSYANSWKQTEPNAGSRGQFRPYWDRILGHYEGRKGIALKYSHKMADRVVADGGGGGSTSGGYDHLGFTTLTCTRPAISKDQAPITLSASIQWSGLTYPYGELNNVEPGRKLKLVPALPAGVEDSGNWRWNTGDLSRVLELTADTSALYRVVYTDKNGVKSSQLFSISVNGDCRPDIYTYNVTTTTGVYKDTLIRAKQNSKVKFEFSASSWRSAYLWSTGETTSVKELTLTNKDTTIALTGTNQGGAKAVFNFKITVEILGHSYIKNDGKINYGDKVVTSRGTKLTLAPTVKSGMEGGSWKWNDGSTQSTLVLNNVQAGQECVVTYTKDGKEYELKYTIVLVPEENAFSYLPMDEGDGPIAADIWSGNDAAMNSASWTPSGINNGSVHFDGTANSYMLLPNGFLNSVEDFTISCWINPDALDTWARVWDFGAGTNYYMFLTTKAGSGYPGFTMKAGASEQTVSTTKLPETGKWSHLAVTKTGNVARIYLNGVETGINSAMNIKPVHLGYTYQNYIGKSQWPDPLYKGYIDEFRMYQKGMNRDEIINVMSKIKPLNPGYSVDGGAIEYDSIITVKAGQSVILTPMFKAGITMTGGTWLWENGATSQTLTVSNIQQSSRMSVTYLYNGTSYSQNYAIRTSKDVTADFVTNYGFNSSNNYLKGTGTGVNLAAGTGAVQSVNFWTQLQEGEWATGTSYEYGYSGTFNGVAVPAAGYDGVSGNGNGALALSAGWGDGVKYTQAVTLPAGEYNLSAMVYNANQTAAQGISLLGWIPATGKSVMSTLKSFTTSGWLKDEVKFSLQSETSGKIQLGLQSITGTGTSGNAKIFIDYITLLQSDLQTSLPANSAENSNVIVSQVSKHNYRIKSDLNYVKVKIFNANGNLLKEIVLTSPETYFTLSGYPIYILQILSDNTSKTIKLIDVF